MASPASSGSLRYLYLEKRKEMSQTDRDLSHVLWIGGSPCAGKSTIAHTIARTHVFVSYFLDPMARNHVRRRLEKGDAAMEAFVKMNVDQRWD